MLHQRHTPSEIWYFVTKKIKKIIVDFDFVEISQKVLSPVTSVEIFFLIMGIFFT